MEALISIIIPVYNVEKYLEECIESCINQTYRNIEIILINDGSTDNSLEICQKYANVDNRIIVKSISNSGVAHARNVGIGVSKGDYITFIDSDDFVDKRYCELMYKVLEERKADIACCTSYYLQNDNGTYNMVHDSPPNVHKAMYSFNDYKYYNKPLIGGWNSLLKRECTDILFPLLKQGEDTAHGALVSYYIKPTISYVDDALYYYRYNNTSLTKTKNFSLEKFTDSFKAFFLHMVLFSEYKAFLNEDVLYRTYDAYLKFRKYKKYEHSQVITEFLKKHYNEIQNSSINNNIKWKIKLICKYKILLYPRFLRDIINYSLERNLPQIYKILHK